MAGYGFFVAMPFFVSVGTVAVIYGAVQGGARWLEWRPLRVMGERSYGLYLLHPIVGVAPMWILGSESVWLRVFVMLPVSWVAASLSYRYVEAPFRRSSASRLERRRNAPALEVAERKVG
jgi:peptidoglycan/LPS O-acetylase OafA/YrhL